MKDLFVLTADADMQAAMKTLLSARHRALGIRNIAFTVERHTQRDAGCRRRAADRLRGYAHDHAHALVMFDRDGSGDSSPREDIQTSVDAQLSAAGWPDRSKTIVIDPELEVWIWGSSPHVARLLGWQTNEVLRSWLHQHGLWPEPETKPPDPKAALHRALRIQNRHPNASLFGEVARRVGLGRCQDPAFQELRSTLKEWFPAADPA